MAGAPQYYRLTTRAGEDVSDDFKWPDYAVLSTVLAMSVAIGLYFGCFGGKNKTNEEYLLGNRRMNPIPVALSLLCSYVSSITLLGTPVEIYYYGTQLAMVLIAYIPLTLSLAYVFVPIYFNLQFTSVYEYLEWRFNRPVRLALSMINIVYGIFLMAMVVYGPAISLSLVTGLHHRLLVAIIFIVCIFYSSLGGFKAVLWTDSLQAVIMVASMAVVVAVGSKDAGGFSVIWQRVIETDRNMFFNFDVDPRTRHTIWTAVIGGYFQWLPMYANQAQIQRYISLPNMNSVKKALLVNLLGLFFLMGLCYTAGVVIYGRYYDCDPFFSKRIQAADQLLPIFVMDTLKDYQGLPGLFVAGITCAGLSTVSSGVNALSASITEDYVKHWKPNLTPNQINLSAKLISLVAGLLSFGFVYIAEQMGNIFSAATSLLGILGGPTFGTFVCGMFFPWANTIGVSIGICVSFVIMTFFGVGSTILTNQQKLPFQAKSLFINGCGDGFANLTNPIPEMYWKERDDSAFIQILSLSPLWYPALGMITSVAFGMLFSYIATKMSHRNLNPPMPSKLFIPVILKLWQRVCPNEVDRLVSFKVMDLKTKNEKNVATIADFSLDTNYNNKNEKK